MEDIVKPGRFKRRYEEVTALQWFPNRKIEGIHSHYWYGVKADVYSIIEQGDWIVFGDFGVEVLKDSDFRRKYESLENVNDRANCPSSNSKV